MPLLRSLPKPYYRLSKVLRYATALGVLLREQVLRDGVALVCGFPKPHYRHRMVLWYASAIAI
jgi:hypothetical protein